MKRRFTQFSLRFLFIAFTTIAILIWLYNPFARRKEQCIRKLRELNVPVMFDYQWSESGSFLPNAKPPGNSIMKWAIGEHYAAHPIDVELGESPDANRFTDEDAVLLSSFTELKWLSLQNTQVTDDGLTALSTLTKLKRLDLEASRVTPNGVRAIKKMLPTLEVVSDFPEVDLE